MNKEIFHTIPWIKVLGMALITLILLTALVRERIVTPPYEQVSVTGRGVVAYTPDIARVVLGVSVERAADAVEALDSLSTTMNRVVPAIETVGIAEEDIVTQAFALSPVYDYLPEQPQQLAGYDATQNLSVTVRGDDETVQGLIEKVLQVASDEGVNRIIGITFESSEAEALRTQAIQKAVTQAKIRAQETADTAGVRLGKIVSWWENPIQIPGQPNPYGGYGGYGGAEMTQDMKGMPMVPTGGQEVIVEVGVNYRLK